MLVLYLKVRVGFAKNNAEEGEEEEEEEEEEELLRLPLSILGTFSQQNKHLYPKRGPHCSWAPNQLRENRSICYLGVTLRPQKTA